MSSFQELVNTIKSKFETEDSVVIGISGFGGSGKTTLAKSLVESLETAATISIDDFLLRDKLFTPSEKGEAFDRNRFKSQVLDHLSDEVLKFQVYDWDKDELVWQEIKKPKYLIIEGISIWHPGLENYYDFKIWVDESLEDAATAGKNRPGEEKNLKYWDEVWTPSDKAYYEKYLPDEQADIFYRR